MNITSKPSGAYALVAHIELGAEESVQYLEVAKKRITEEVSIEGFRKGKAPQHLVDQRIDPQAVRAEALELALEGSFGDAAKKEQWDILKTADLKVERNDATGLRYSVQIFLWPPMTIPDLATIHADRKPITVNDTEIDESLDTIRNMRATFLDKTEPAAVGDRVEVDFDATIDGKALEGGSSRNHPLVIGGKSFMPGFEEELIGLFAGQTKKFSIKAPADYYEQKVAGKQLEFSVTVHRVQAVLKPAADDAFAQALGKFTSITQLRTSIGEGIKREKEGKEQQRVRLAILDSIIEQAKVPAPEVMVKDELDDMVHRFGHDLQGRGIELGMYLARMKKTEDDLRRDWKPEAERQVRIMLVLRTVAKDQHIAIAPEELDAAMNDALGELVRQKQISAEQIDPQRMKTVLHERMLTDRTLEFLERTCAIGL